jgi:hypothetical protein
MAGYGAPRHDECANAVANGAPNPPYEIANHSATVAQFAATCSAPRSERAKIV